MSRSRRNFSAEFKTNLVLQLLKGEKELNVLAVENDIQISSAIGRRNSLPMPLLPLITNERTTFAKNLRKSGKRKPSMQKRLAS